MKQNRFFNLILICVVSIIIFTGCNSSPAPRNYVGMTRQEVADMLAQHAFRDRWSQNKFEIWLSNGTYSASYRNAGEVTADQTVMTAEKWQCDFLPQRNWLLGWNGFWASCHFQVLKFENDRVVSQQSASRPYWVHGYDGIDPFPQNPKNFHKVNDNLYRSGQPENDEFESLHTFHGIRSILNLRENHSDQEDVEAVNQKYDGAIKLYEIPLDTGNITVDDLIRILTVVRDAPKPLLIHCWHGSDRTGCAVAACRYGSARG